MTRVIETDICIIGGGICAAMVAERIAPSSARILLVEAGNPIFNFSSRLEERRRYLDYGYNPWPQDHVEGMSAQGIQSRTMAVGGMALHWGGACPRFTAEDFRLKSLYGIGQDWPISYDDLEPFYQEAEERIGVAGEAGPPSLDVRSKPYPMPPVPLSYNQQLLREWGQKSGIPWWGNPVARNSVPYRGRNVCARCDTCLICPTGAKYSPDFTFQELLSSKRIELLPRTVVRRLAPRQGRDEIERAEALERDRPEDPVHIRARYFVLAAGYVWSSHLLLLSRSSRSPRGLANRSGLVGKYLTGHRPFSAYAQVPMKLYPGIYDQNSLLSKQFQRPGQLQHYIRHDLRIWESTLGREPRLRGSNQQLLLGDAVLEDWRSRLEVGSARLRAYYDVIPDRESSVSLDSQNQTPWGDPLPKIEFRDSAASIELRPRTEESILQVFQRIVRAGGGKILSSGVQDVYDHPGGGCRMGTSPESSVVDSFGRTHDHENLFVVGAPTLVSGGCANGTLTFAALALRSAAKISQEL